MVGEGWGGVRRGDKVRIERVGIGRVCGMEDIGKVREEKGGREVPFGCGYSSLVFQCGLSLFFA